MRNRSKKTGSWVFLQRTELLNLSHMGNKQQSNENLTHLFHWGRTYSTGDLQLQKKIFKKLEKKQTAQKAEKV